jgi:hypothetical protein
MWSWTSRGSVGHDRAGDGGGVICVYLDIEGQEVRAG